MKQRNVFHKEDANIIVTRAMAYILESFKEDKKYFDYNVAPDEGLWMQVGNRKITVDATDKTVKSIWGMKFKFDNEFNVIGSEYKNIIEHAYLAFFINFGRKLYVCTYYIYIMFVHI